MSPTGLLAIFMITCAFGLKTVPLRTSLRSALNAVNRKQSNLEMNSPNYNNNLQAFKHHSDQNDRGMGRQGFDSVNDEELLDDLVQENGQEETIGDGFQNVNDSLESAYKAYLKHLARRLQLQNEGPSSNFRERERSKNYKYMNEQQEELTKELMEKLLEEEAAAENENYGIPREISEDPRYEYELSAGEPFKTKYYNDRSQDENWGDYYQEQDYYPALMPTAERRNVNGRYPLGRDFRNYRDMVKRFPVAKRSPKPMTKKRQITDPKVAQDLASLFGSQPTENHNNVHETTVSEQNHTFNHADHTTVTPSSTTVPKLMKEKEPSQSLKSKERIIDVQKKSIDWSQYFGLDRRKKKAVLTAKPGSQNQDDAFFLQHYYSTMGDNLQSPKRNNDRELEEKMYKLQQIDSRLKNIKDLAFQEAILEGSQDTENSEEMKESILNKLATAYSMEKMRQALRDFRNNIIMQHQNSYSDNYQDGIDFDKNEDKHDGREVAEGKLH